MSTPVLAAAVGSLSFALTAMAVLWSLRRVRRADAQLALRSAQLEALQASFNRFVPSQVVDDVVAQGAARMGIKREVTVLFADLQGFTLMSDRLDAAVVVTLLNRYFTSMSHAINANHGHVSKFIGDGIMALFGAIVDNPWQAQDGVQAAVEMQRAAVALNEALRADGLPELSVGIGLHKGEVVAGIVGSDQLVEFTVIGDVVNVAARVESLTRRHGAKILITRPVKDGLDERFRLTEMPPAEVKGKPEPIATWAVEP